MRKIVTAFLAVLLVFVFTSSSLAALGTYSEEPQGSAPNRPGALTLEATAKTFRYLDPEELLAQQNERQKADKAKKEKKK